MSKPLVSTVIPVYNGERFLAAAIESVAAQSYPARELIVVDDGSTDSSPAVARTQPGVKLIEQRNRGVAAARNAGIAAAQGEFLAFLDQDDLWVPRKLELQMAAMLADPEVGYVTGRQVMFLDEGLPPPAWLKPALLDRPTPAPQPGTVLVRRSTFERIGTFDESYDTSSDAEWFFRAKDRGVKTVALDDVLLRKRVHDENELSRVKDIHSELLRIVRGSVSRQRGPGDS